MRKWIRIAWLPAVAAALALVPAFLPSGEPPRPPAAATPPQGEPAGAARADSPPPPADALAAVPRSERAQPRLVEPRLAACGRAIVTEDMVARRIETMRARRGAVLRREEAFLLLLEEAVMEEVARRHGTSITTRQLEEEALRVDRETAEPDTLARIQAVFEGDRTRYLREFLRPTLVNQALAGFVSSSPTIQDERRAQAERALSGRAGVGGPFREFTVELNGRSRLMGIEPPAEWAAYAASLQPGQIVPHVVEAPHSFQVLRLARYAGPEDFAFDVVEIPKMTMPEWLEAEARRIGVIVADPGLRAFVAGLSDHWLSLLVR